MRLRHLLLVLAFAGLFVAIGRSEGPAPGYKLVKAVPIPGDGSWDYLTVDPEGRRVYASHGTKVDVFDADSGELKGQVADTPGVHGIAIAAEVGRGFTSNGKANAVSVFDLKTLKTISTVPTGKGPDYIHYDPQTKRVFAFNGGGRTATVIDAGTAKEAGTVMLDGRPEAAASDGKGTVYVNLVDKGEVLKIDAEKLTVAARWPVAPAKQPVSLAIDVKTGRLFVGCRSKELVVLSTETGKAVATLPIGQGVDAGAFDPAAKLAFCSCGDGTVTIVAQESADKYAVLETLKTKPGAKTMAFDPKTQRLYLPAMDTKPSDNPNGRPVPIPGTFALLIYGKENR
jgi:DNA-binding beta-propeller fold protein YncE